MNRRKQIQRAHTVIAWLVKAEPGYENAKTDGWEVAVTNRIRAERWPEVCAAVEANPDLSAATIAERLAIQANGPKLEIDRPECKSPTPGLPTVTAEPLEPGAPRDRALRHIADIRAKLASKETQQ